jgi:prolycopene isomerase
MADYDVIVIGAGNGGLTAAAGLARRGINVLLLERHNVPAGALPVLYGADSNSKWRCIN